MHKFFKKAGILILSLIALSILVFFLARMAPGDPLKSYYGERVERMGEAERARSEERLGLHDPIPAQYVRWVSNALSGDFGISFKYKAPAREVVGDALLNTLLLGVSAFLLTFLLACLLGAASARRGGFFSALLERIGALTSSIPDFWFALILILIFSVMFRIFPSSGAFTPGTGGRDVFDRARHLVLPLLTVVFSHLFYYAALVAGLFREEMGKDYVLFLKASGISERSVRFRHVFINILPELFSLMVSAVPHLIGGEFVVEMVFSYPGLGALAYESARYHDYNLLMLVTLLTGALVLCLSMAAEAVSERIDPSRTSAKVFMEGEENGKAR